MDLGYIGGGLYFRQNGLNSSYRKTSQQLQGYGISIIIQGGFPLLEDATMIWLHHRNTVRIRRGDLSFLRSFASSGLTCCRTRFVVEINEEKLKKKMKAIFPADFLQDPSY